MSCTIITVAGQRKVTDQEAMEFARIAGITFIRLKHIKGAAEVEYAQRGFQSAEVYIETDQTGGRSYKYKLSKDPFTGEDCMGQRQLIFQPDRHTGTLHADLPDTPYNRQVLISCYFNNPQWTIVDPTLDKEIRKLAEEFQKSIPNKPSKDEVIKAQKEREEELREENRKLREQLKLKSAEDEAIKEATTVSEDDMLGALGLTELEAKNLRKKAKEEVYEEMADEVAAIQNEKGRAWASSREYREKIAPVIDVRYQKKLEELYAEHKGAGVNS